jgi:hypothetical protein
MKEISVRLLNAEECFALIGRLLNVFHNDLKTDAVVNKVLPRLIDLSTGLSQILRKADSTRSITNQLAEQNRVRNEAFICFRDYCGVFTHVPDPKKVAAAKKLTELIRRVGWRLHAKGYTEQTASQKSLIEALEEPEYLAAIKTIDAQNWVVNLKATNDDFENILKLKSEVMAQGKTPTVAECKQIMVRYLKPLMTYLELMSNVTPATYKGVTAKANESIEYVSISAKSRQTRRENKQTEEPENTIETAA